MYARCFHFLKSIQGNVGLELFPWKKILMLAALFTIDSVRHKLGWDANNAVMEFLGPNLSREKKTEHFRRV